MDTIDQIFELRAELHGCRLTKAERAKAKAELAALIAQSRAEGKRSVKTPSQAAARWTSAGVQFQGSRSAICRAG